MKCFNELLISWQNETFYRTSRQSTQLQKRVAIRSKTCTDVSLGIQTGWRLSGKQMAPTWASAILGTCIMDHFYVTSCQLLLPPSFKVLTRICRIFYVTISTTMTTIQSKLNRIQKGHFMTYLASMMGNITRKQQPLCSFLKYQF